MFLRRCAHFTAARRAHVPILPVLLGKGFHLYLRHVSRDCTYYLCLGTSGVYCTHIVVFLRPLSLPLCFPCQVFQRPCRGHAQQGSPLYSQSHHCKEVKRTYRMMVRIESTFSKEPMNMYIKLGGPHKKYLRLVLGLCLANLLAKI